MKWAIAFSASLLLSGGVACAEDLPAKCTLRVIHALNEPQPSPTSTPTPTPAPTIDPRITRLRPYFEKAPFTAWRKFQLLDTKEFTLTNASTQSFDLPNHKKASITYTDHMLRPDGKHRLRLKMGITHGEKQIMQTTFVLDEGGVVLEVGQKYQNGILVLGISCETH